MQVKPIPDRVEQTTNRHIAKFISGIDNEDFPDYIKKVIIKNMWNLSNDIVAIYSGGQDEPDV